MIELPQLEGYTVHLVPAFRALKPYICPNCVNEIPSGQGHVVVWPSHDLGARRHWHRHCWRIAARSGRIA